MTDATWASPGDVIFSPRSSDKCRLVVAVRKRSPDYLTADGGVILHGDTICAGPDVLNAGYPSTWWSVVASVE